MTTDPSVYKNRSLIMLQAVLVLTCTRMFCFVFIRFYVLLPLLIDVRILLVVGSVLSRTASKYRMSLRFRALKIILQIFG